MSNDQEPSGKFIQRVQPLRDLESNWTVDLARNLEEYLLKICSGEISGDDDPRLAVNFAEAALLLQGSVQVYSRKVEYLYSLVLQALEFISQKSQQDQAAGPSTQPGENNSSAADNEDNDPFWVLDDIPVDAKNLLDNFTCKDAPYSHFVKPPANVVVLEGDSLDATGDAGELESYLLVTNDIYHEFILLDPCDAVAVDNFLNVDDKARKGNNNTSRNSKSKDGKSFLSPSRLSVGTGTKLSAGKFHSSQSPGVDHAAQAADLNTGSFTSYDIPGNNDEGHDTKYGYPEREVSDDSDNEDPWKPLNPHEPGNLKVKPFRKVKLGKKHGVSSNKQISTASEFPPARLHGTTSSDLNEVWERKCGQQKTREPQSLPFYEKLRQTIVHGMNRDLDAFLSPQDNNDDDEYDSGDADLGPNNFDMSKNADFYKDEDPHPEKFDDGDLFDNEEFHEDPNGQANLDDLCRAHLDTLLASIAETEKQTELAARVSKWKQKIEQNLEEQDMHPPFDIHEYGERILDKLSLGGNMGDAMSFVEVVSSQEKHAVARTFSALLQLVNNGDVELDRGPSDQESTCYTAVDPFHVRLLRSEKKRDGIHLRSSKKRLKSPKMKGHQKGERRKPGKENRPSPRPSPSASYSLRSCGSRCTPEGKKRRKSRLVDPLDHSMSDIA